MSRPLGRDDLVLSHFSLPLRTPFEERVAAAAAAGFAGIGYFVREYVKLVAEGSLESIAKATALCPDAASDAARLQKMREVLASCPDFTVQ